MSFEETIFHFYTYLKRFGFLLDIGATCTEDFMNGFVTYLSDESYRN